MWELRWNRGEQMFSPRTHRFRLEIQDAVETDVAEIGHGCNSRRVLALGMHGNGKLRGDQYCRVQTARQGIARQGSLRERAAVGELPPRDRRLSAQGSAWLDRGGFRQPLSLLRDERRQGDPL